MQKEVNEHEAELIDLIRKDGWPLFRAIDSTLATMPGYESHNAFAPGPQDGEAIQNYRTLIHRLMH
ncbi:hypothetical protein [Streptomyces sp. CFMR 7]|uniref:hypothetical protein n=1 Tax=Streptomyces sp. CFMR 7 TaxID=1649184 RepID=UPI00119E34EA|nr:hypothetical protein [Streptomyces sp. CFMR 7]